MLPRESICNRNRRVKEFSGVGSLADGTCASRRLVLAIQWHARANAHFLTNRGAVSTAETETCYIEAYSHGGRSQSPLLPRRVTAACIQPDGQTRHARYSHSDKTYSCFSTTIGVRPNASRISRLPRYHRSWFEAMFVLRQRL